MKVISEETTVKYKNETELSYLDKGGLNIQLFNNGELLGKCKVWQDSEMDKREYIILNNCIIYLDTIKII